MQALQNEAPKVVPLFKSDLELEAFRKTIPNSDQMSDEDVRVMIRNFQAGKHYR